MDSYTIDQLSDEVFGHLCNIALDKCNDKLEKRRAGCGGRAMRRRVLIKNFVSELMRVQNDREQEICCEEELPDGTVTYYLQYEDESPNHTDSLLSEEVSLDFDDLPKSDVWLVNGDNYSDYLGDSLLNSHIEGGQEATQPADNKMPSSRPPARLGLYDLFETVGPTEQASEGGKPEDVLPQDGFVPAHAYDSFVTYELGSPSLFELEDLHYSPLSEGVDPLPLQPVRVEPSDKLFLSLNNNSYSEMKTFTTLSDSLSPLDDPILTDLDAGKENNCFSKKRKSNEEPLLSDAIISDQKRLKL